MKNKLYIIITLFLIYVASYLCIGRNSLATEIIENKNFLKHQSSIQIQLYNLNVYQRNQQEVKQILAKKGFKTIAVNYAENFLDKKKYSYWLEIQQLVPFIAFAYDGTFKKNVISEEHENLYVWFFLTWCKIYDKKNQPKKNNASNYLKMK